MVKNPLNWFLDDFFINAFFISILIVFVVDAIMPMFLKGRRAGPAIRVKDRGSFILIQICVVLSLGIGITCRVNNWGVWMGVFQYAGLVVMLFGTFVRGWAIFKLGRFFSRIVEIETGHRLIQDGPDRWLRHPAYTGMLLIYVGFIMGLGTWLGALIALVLILASTLYRIRVEEKTLLDAFGEEYRQYMSKTWRLIPGW